jgi:hypothetical protein
MDIERTPVFIGRNFRLSEWIPHNPLDKRETRWDRQLFPVRHQPVSECPEEIAEMSQGQAKTHLKQESPHPWFMGL